MSMKLFNWKKSTNYLAYKVLYYSVCVCVCVCVCVSRTHAHILAYSCPALCNPVDCIPPGSSVHEIFLARILEWAVISYSRESSKPGNKPSSLASRAGRFFTTSVTWEAQKSSGHSEPAPLADPPRFIMEPLRPSAIK